MSDRLMKLARNQPCQIRLPGCTGGGGDTVAAHFRDLSLGAGTGIRPHSIFCAHSCAHCHDLVDRRIKDDLLGYGELRLAHAIGVLRTIHKLLQMGVVKA